MTTMFGVEPQPRIGTAVGLPGGEILEGFRRDRQC